jgi:hypothetical protein
MEKVSKKYKFWLDSPSELYKDGKYMDIVPSQDMTRVEQLNAITRFAIYAIILLLIFKKPSTWFYVPAVIIIIGIFMHRIYKFDPKGREKELYLQHGKELMEGDLGTQESYGFEAEHRHFEGEHEHDVNYELEVGRYDSDGNLLISGNYNKKKKNINRLDYSLNELDEYQKAACRKPTKDNPFMNPPITDFSKEFSPVGCNADDEDIKKEIEDSFNTDLYRDVQDLFDVKNSQRQFYTVPVTSIPNDQQGFAEWLYKSPNTCKDSAEMCLRYEDLRYKR